MSHLEDFDYIISEEGLEGQPKKKGVVIQRYTGNESKVVIPDEIDGLPVVGLSYTFIHKKELEEVTLPKQLEFIENMTFSGCKNLKYIHLPPSLKKIGYAAFQNCLSLEAVLLDNSSPLDELELAPEIFSNCSKLVDENGFILLNTLLVGYYGKEERLTIPQGITKIGEGAFASHQSILEVTMPDSVKVIGLNAFYHCLSLTRLVLSKEITSIGEGAFSHCSALEDITLPPKLTVVPKEMCFFCTKLDKIHWNQSLLEISENAFSRCSSLETISIPKNVNKIHKSFTGCRNLKKITIPSSVEIISKKSFAQCDSLSEITLEERNEGDKARKLELGAFSYTKEMQKNFLEKGEELPSLLVNSFSKPDYTQYCQDLLTHWDSLSPHNKNILVTEWKKKISSKLGKGKNKLRNLVFLQSTAKEMSYYFQEDCHLELAELDYFLAHAIERENTVETALLLDYKNKNFDKNLVEEAKERKELLEIGLELPTLKELREKWSVKVGESELTLTGYKGENRMEVIPDAINTGLPISYLRSANQPPKKSSYHVIEKLYLPENFKGFLNPCFCGSSLKEMILPKTMTEIQEKMCWKAANLEIIHLHEGITAVQDQAFFGCHSLKEIEFPSSLDLIGESAFASCLHLEKITFSSGLTTISKSAFQDCQSLKEVVLPEGLEHIGKMAFSHCIRLEKLILPSHFTKFPSDIVTISINLAFVGTEGGKNLLPSIGG